MSCGSSQGLQMSYLDEFSLLISEGNLSQFFRLWEEYSQADAVDGRELAEVLKVIKTSVVAPTFGEHIDSVLPLWKRIEKLEGGDDVLRLILDLQTTNSPLLADLAISNLQKRFGTDKNYNEKLRLVGLRARHSFQGAITNFLLLNHLGKGKFVFHSGGWGVGEVMEFSLLRESILLEFEGIGAPKDLSFENAFKNLIPLSSDHFLARRFGNPDILESEGKKDPLALIHLLLRDLGPKSAAEIKEELCELVIPEDDWTKWWQLARAKIKKDMMIAQPVNARAPFVLREEAVSHDVQFKKALKKVETTSQLITVVYNFTRDFPEVLKNSELRGELKESLVDHLEKKEGLNAHEIARNIQLSILLADIYPSEYGQALEKMIAGLPNLVEVMGHVDVIAYKKRVLVAIRQSREDWVPLFLHLLFVVGGAPLRDYIFKELLSDPMGQALAKDKIHELLNKATLFPDAFFWYFQKLASEEDVPFNDADNKRLFLEAYCILLHYIENNEQYKELTKKMHQLLSAKRYLVVRQLIEGSTTAYLQEFLLLASKCYTLSKQDQRILHSLAEVVQPDLKKKKEEVMDEVLWTTAEGYRKLQERIQHIGTIEIVENAREIEAARAYGDLRENSEYKFALEKRSRLQGELQTLSRQLNIARILTKDDITANQVSVGSIVSLKDSKGRSITYTLLGPWDADPDRNILSFQSKLAQAMIGYEKGDIFDFQGEKYEVQSIKSFL